MYPIKLSPVFKDYIWGGSNLKNNWNKNADSDKLAESWELACHRDGTTKIANGHYKNVSFKELILEKGKDFVGTKCEDISKFPVLIKFIDAFDNLSVQVHPNDDYALRVENEFGKTEVWYIIDCEPGSSLIFGFNKDITKFEFEKSISEGTLLDLVNKVPVKKGDIFFIEAGTLHAIGKGILILEIQQNSNSTYRVYDYDRLDPLGNPRDLHVDKALDVTNLSELNMKDRTENCYVVENGYSKKTLAECEYFSSYIFDIEEDLTLNVDETSFHSIIILDSGLTLESKYGNMIMQKGDSIFLPAKFEDYKILGKGKLVLTHL